MAQGRRTGEVHYHGRKGLSMFCASSCRRSCRQRRYGLRVSCIHRRRFQKALFFSCLDRRRRHHTACTGIWRAVFLPPKGRSISPVFGFAAKCGRKCPFARHRVARKICTTPKYYAVVMPPYGKPVLSGGRLQNPQGSEPAGRAAAMRREAAVGKPDAAADKKPRGGAGWLTLRVKVNAMHLMRMRFQFARKASDKGRWPLTHMSRRSRFGRPPCV